MKVETTHVAEGVLVRLDGALMFAVMPGDTEERTLGGAQAECRRGGADVAARDRRIARVAQPEVAADRGG